MSRRRVVVLLVACACTANPPVVVAPMSDLAASTRAAVPAAPAGNTAGRLCTATLRVGTVIASPASCWLDEKVGSKTASLHYPCGGGAGEATFGVPFRGTVDETGSVAIEATTIYPWTGDGCDWKSTQRITGSLGDGELTYTYEEHPVDDAGRCSPAYCKAVTRVAVKAK